MELLWACVVGALIVVVGFQAWTLARVSKDRAEHDKATAASLLMNVQLTLEKALCFSDEARETMRIQRESPIGRDDTNRQPQPPVMIPIPPPNFEDGAENRIGG